MAGEKITVGIDLNDDLTPKINGMKKALDGILAGGAVWRIKVDTSEAEKGLARVKAEIQGLSKAAAESFGAGVAMREARMEAEDMRLALEQIAQLTKQASAARLAEELQKAAAAAAKVAATSREIGIVMRDARMESEEMRIALEKIDQLAKQASMAKVAEDAAKAASATEKAAAHTKEMGIAMRIARMETEEDRIELEKVDELIKKASRTRAAMGGGPGGGPHGGAHEGGFMAEQMKELMAGIGYQFGMWNIGFMAAEKLSDALTEVGHAGLIYLQMSNRMADSNRNAAASFGELANAAIGSFTSISQTWEHTQKFIGAGLDVQSAIREAGAVQRLALETGVDISETVIAAQRLRVTPEQVVSAAQAGKPYSELEPEAKAAMHREDMRRFREAEMEHEHSVQERQFQKQVHDSEYLIRRQKLAFDEQMEDRHRAEDYAMEDTHYRINLETEETNRMINREMEMRHHVNNQDMEDRHRVAEQSSQDHDRLHSRQLSIASGIKGVMQMAFQGQRPGGALSEAVEQVHQAMEQGYVQLEKDLGIGRSAARRLISEGAMSPQVLLQEAEAAREQGRISEQRGREAESRTQERADYKESYNERIRQEDQIHEIQKQFHAEDLARTREHTAQRMVAERAFSHFMMARQEEIYQHQIELEQTYQDKREKLTLERLREELDWSRRINDIEEQHRRENAKKTADEVGRINAGLAAGLAGGAPVMPPTPVPLEAKPPETPQQKEEREVQQQLDESIRKLDEKLKDSQTQETKSEDTAKSNTDATTQQTQATDKSVGSTKDNTAVTDKNTAAVGKGTTATDSLKDSTDTLDKTTQESVRWLKLLQQSIDECCAGMFKPKAPEEAAKPSVAAAAAAKAAAPTPPTATPSAPAAGPAYSPPPGFHKAEMGEDMYPGYQEAEDAARAQGPEALRRFLEHGPTPYEFGIRRWQPPYGGFKTPSGLEIPYTPGHWEVAPRKPGDQVKWHEPTGGYEDNNGNWIPYVPGYWENLGPEKPQTPAEKRALEPMPAAPTASAAPTPGAAAPKPGLAMPPPTPWPKGPPTPWSPGAPTPWGPTPKPSPTPQTGKGRGYSGLPEEGEAAPPQLAPKAQKEQDERMRGLRQKLRTLTIPELESLLPGDVKSPDVSGYPPTQDTHKGPAYEIPQPKKGEPGTYTDPRTGVTVRIHPGDITPQQKAESPEEPPRKSPWHEARPMPKWRVSPGPGKPTYLETPEGREEGPVMPYPGQKLPGGGRIPVPGTTFEPGGKLEPKAVPSPEKKSDDYYRDIFKKERDKHGTGEEKKGGDAATETTLKSVEGLLKNVFTGAA